ncbi:MAG TPA: group II intron reverse transcriptase/maturase [Acidobacteriaceae bacterium]|nr:group II intron reverse transcriptase/maturase [Acidobacteriaceae bacterium]
MSLIPPETVQKLRNSLHAKAKGSPGYRFYAVYDKMYRPDVLAHAYDCCLANKGAAGVDGQTFEDIEEYGLDLWLGELQKELKDKSYRPSAVRRVWIPKPDGKQRPLGVPTIKDRVAQMAAVLVLEPIFEADLPPEQYAYRPQRSALDAVSHVQKLLLTGHCEVVDADLSGYFDSIPHAELLKSLARRISDGAMMHVLKSWLCMAVEEEDERGRKHRTTRNRDEGKGTPQGAPISPLLSNLYMRRFVLGWKTLGHQERLKAFVVNYADDLVICCRAGAAEALAAMREMMSRLKLTVNETKTRVCTPPKETFDFLGYTFGRLWSPRTGRPYLGVCPSKKRVQRICDAVTEATDRRSTSRPVEEVVAELNRKVSGWSNYFSLGSVSKAYCIVDAHVGGRLRMWLKAKHAAACVGKKRFTDAETAERLGLFRLRGRRGSLPWAKA